MSHRLQVGIDFSQKRADWCLLFPNGQPLELHQLFDNSPSGYSLARQLLLDALARYQFDGLNVSGEATGYYRLSFFPAWRQTGCNWPPILTWRPTT